MPQIEATTSTPSNGLELPASASLGAWIDFALAFLRRRWLVIVVCLAVSLALGAAFLYTAKPSYTATTTMMLETRKDSILQQSLLGDAPPDAAWIESQIGVMKSQSVAAYVVRQLRLADDPEFSYPISPFEKLLARLGWGTPAPQSDAERTGNAIATVMGGLDIKRLGPSYLIRIDFRGSNPEQAAKVANAMVDAYIYDQLNAKYQANRRAGDWLQERLQALREQAATAEKAVIDFKSKNNIVTTGGTLMNDKQLGEVSGQLATARTSASDLQVRLERIEAVRKSYQPDQPPGTAGADENVTEAMNNGIINKLRGQYLDLVNREADWSTRYGKNHVAVVNLRNQIRDLRRSIYDELGRILETTKSEFEIAKRRQAEAEKGLASMISRSTETNQAQVTLFSLEAAAQSYRKLYDSFLQKHTETVQQQSFPISDARAISSASAVKTFPKPGLVWLIAAFGGGMLGVGFGALRELLDRGFRTREQVRSVLDTECLAMVPLLTSSRASQAKVLTSRPAKLVEYAVSAARGNAGRSIYSTPAVMRTIIEAPSSPYAEAVRSIKLTVDLNKKDTHTKVLGLTSCLPSEGKSSLAAAMATLIAHGGARVLLVDCDIRNPSLSRALAPEASLGLLDVIVGKAALADAVWGDASSKLAFLPAVAGRPPANATELLASDAAKSLFETLKLSYDYVIVDSAPLVAGVDVRATSTLVDSYLLVVEWGATKIDAVQYALRNAPGIQQNIAGVVLNKVDLNAMGRYDSYGSAYYYGESGRTGLTN